MTIALRNTGIEPVGEMLWGTHFCHFYETRDDLLETLLPFFKAGLEAGEFCAWVVSEPLTEEGAWQALDRAVPRLDRYVSDRSIEGLQARDVYLAGGETDLHRIIGNWGTKLERGVVGGRTEVEAVIGDQKRASEALQEAQVALAHVTRLTTISELTASLAHEVNQPLAAIEANAAASLNWLDHTPPALDEARQGMQLVIRDAQRAGDVIAHARALVKKSDGEMSLVDVDQLIREVLSLVQPEVQKHAVVVEEALAEDLLPVRGDRVRLQQLVLNLIMNGIEAMAEVAARPRRLVVSCVRGQGEARPGRLGDGHDAGVGAAADLEPLFDPFFTTKLAGLPPGVPIIRSIAHTHPGPP